GGGGGIGGGRARARIFSNGRFRRMTPKARRGPPSNASRCLRRWPHYGRARRRKSRKCSRRRGSTIATARSMEAAPSRRKNRAASSTAPCRPVDRHSHLRSEAPRSELTSRILVVKPRTALEDLIFVCRRLPFRPRSEAMRWMSPCPGARWRRFGGERYAVPLLAHAWMLSLFCCDQRPVHFLIV